MALSFSIDILISELDLVSHSVRERYGSGFYNFVMISFRISGGVFRGGGWKTF